MEFSKYESKKLIVMYEDIRRELIRRKVWGNYDKHNIKPLKKHERK